MSDPIDRPAALPWRNLPGCYDPIEGVWPFMAATQIQIVGVVLESFSIRVKIAVSSSPGELGDIPGRVLSEKRR
jgi:hypothetical protein